MMSPAAPPAKRPDEVFQDIKTAEAMYSLLSTKEGKARLAEYRELVESWQAFVEDVSDGLKAHEAKERAQAMQLEAQSQMDAARRQAEQMLDEAKADVASRKAALEAVAQQYRDEVTAREKKIAEAERDMQARESNLASRAQAAEEKMRQAREAHDRAEAARAEWERKVQALKAVLGSTST